MALNLLFFDKNFKNISFQISKKKKLKFSTLINLKFLAGTNIFKITIINSNTQVNSYSFFLLLLEKS